MDTLFTLFPMAIVFLIAFALVYVRYKMPEWKGKFSEGLVNRKLLGLSDEYIVFSNLLFENNGYSTQIDHLVVSPYGVFVIETKGYKGWILGGEYSENWTQNIYGKTFTLYNPIKQNDGHVRFLRHLLKCRVDIPLIPIVVFNNDAELKVHVKNHIVINRSSLISTIRKHRNSVLTKETIDWVVNTIVTNSTSADRDELKKHTENVYARKYRTAQSISNGVCPDCGGSLVLRKGKFGNFYGCSNYPKCKFKMNS